MAMMTELAEAQLDVVEVEGGEFVCVCREGALVDLPDEFDESEGIPTNFDDFCAATASLDVNNYLQRDADTIFETAFLSIRSDNFRDPKRADYDATIPPANYREATLREDADQWMVVVNKELKDLKDMGVYREEVLPEGRKAIGNRWVFEFKLSTDGSPPKAKARLVAQGFSQVPFVDYDATFAPVAKAALIWLIAIFTTIHDWELECFDATRAFLWGDLTREIYMKYPPGYQPTSIGGVWRLLKSLYGLKQASRIWYKLLRSTLEKLGFLRSKFDHAVFIFKRKWAHHNVHCILGMHVDDGLCGCNHTPFTTFIKGEIEKSFGIKDLGPMKNFLGNQFERDRKRRELWIHQEAFIELLLAEYGMEDCNPVQTPLDCDHPLGVETDVHPVVENLKQTFQRIVGSLLFLQLCSRPDILYAVLLLLQHCSAPEPRHLAAAKRVLRYLKGTKGYRLHYGGVRKDEVIEGMSDADWGGRREDRASISGFVFFFAGGPLSWSAKKQNCISLSTTEAEYVALTRAVQEGIWLRQSMEQLHMPYPSTIVIATDNESAEKLASNNSDHSKAKHIDIRYHFIRSHIESGIFAIQHTITCWSLYEKELNVNQESDCTVLL